MRLCSAAEHSSLDHKCPEAFLYYVVVYLVATVGHVDGQYCTEDGEGGAGGSFPDAARYELSKVISAHDNHH